MPTPIPPKPPPKPAAKPAPKGAGDFSVGEPVTGLRVSLMPVETGAVPSERRYITILVATVLLETLVFGAAWAGLSFTVKTRQEAQAKANAETLAAQSETAKLGQAAKEADGFARRVDILRGRLDEHAYWTVMFALMERSVRPNVIFVSFAGDTKTGVISVEAEARSFRDIAEQIVLMRSNPLIVDVRTSSAVTSLDATGEITGVNFSLLVKLKPEAWKKPVAAK
ncbi:hypothetical protein HY633_01065 [Candidatus Uhrbacteria bacterium]|nr:hypothetical protein [Candidatus Uhrbacteria bacterium]